MTIRVLVLTHNRIDAVQRCFDSLMPTLKHHGVSCFVLDNASTDGTKEYLRSIDGQNNSICVAYSHENLGVAAGRASLLNPGTFGVKSDDRIVFLDSDTVIIDDNWLDVLSSALNDEAVGVAGPFGSFVLPDWSGFTAGRPGLVDTVAGACQMWKAELFLQGLTVDTEFDKFWHEDANMCLTARDMGYDVVCTPVEVEHYPSHSGYGQDQNLHDANFAKLRAKWQGKNIVKVEGGY
jgi:O-antigen biosynthesis protein